MSSDKDYIEASPDSIINSVCKKLISRSVRGLKKYGVTLDRDDLSFKEWLIHTQEEALDTANYLEKLIQLEEEREQLMLDTVPLP